MVLMPAVIILSAGKSIWFRLFEFETTTFFQFCLKRFHTHFVDGIFQATQLAVAAVAMVSLNGNYFQHRFQRLFFAAYKTKHRCQTRISGSVTMSSTQA